jgi:hypothetical protein
MRPGFSRKPHIEPIELVKTSSPVYTAFALLWQRHATPSWPRKTTNSAREARRKTQGEPKHWAASQTHRS